MKITVHVGGIEGLTAAREAAIAAAGPDDEIELIVSQPVAGSPVERQEQRPASAPSQR